MGLAGQTNSLYNNIIIILILHLSVRDMRREGHLTPAKIFPFSSSMDLDGTCSSSLTQL